MLMKEKIFKGTVLLTVLGLFVFVGFKMPSNSKVAYVNSYDLYEGFTMKKELEQELERFVQSRKPVIDSLEMLLEVKGKTLRLQREPAPDQIIDYERTLEQYEAVKLDFEQKHQELVASYSDQIWTRLNEYTTTYGKKHGYDFIYGANGNGTIMHASESNDITGDVLNFCNEKFEGK